MLKTVSCSRHYKSEILNSSQPTILKSCFKAFKKHREHLPLISCQCFPNAFLRSTLETVELLLSSFSLPKSFGLIRSRDCFIDGGVFLSNYLTWYGRHSFLENSGVIIFSSKESLLQIESTWKAFCFETRTVTLFEFKRSARSSSTSTFYRR